MCCTRSKYLASIVHILPVMVEIIGHSLPVLSPKYIDYNINKFVF